MTATTAAELDLLAARAFPAAEEVRADGWLLRASPSEPPRRVNSALPLDPEPDIDAMQRWYAERGAPARAMITPEDERTGLDAELESRGWVTEALGDILVGDPEVALERLGDREPHVVVPGELPPPGRPGAAAPLHLADERARLVPPAPAARSPDPVVPLVAAGGAGRATVVLHEHWCLVLALEVDPARRREGIAAALVRAWARLAAGRRLYLQVERENRPAHALYAAAGFTRSHGYHYRRAP